MIENGVCVHWGESEEYIELDLDDLDRLRAVTVTREWWTGERKVVRYNTESAIRRPKNGAIELELRYIRGSNGHLDESEIIWGTSIVHLAQNAQSGSVEWYPAEGSHKKYEVKWERVDPGLFKKVKRKRLTATEREQQKFRSMLLAEGGLCALTGEDTTDALEAAHIIPSCCGGAEKLQNGILLRADLHRLYDKEQFRIDQNGHVVDVRNVSRHYRRLLKDLCLDEESLRRVRGALTHAARWPDRSGVDAMR